MLKPVADDFRERFQLHIPSGAAEYLFPVPENAAVCEFKMERSDGRVVKAVVKELDEAKQEFAEAVAEDKWASMLYEATPDIFVVAVGAIPAYNEVKVYITVSVVLVQ